MASYNLNPKGRTEKQIETDIKEIMKLLDIYFNKNHGTLYSIPGRPDIECCINGYYLAIETKKEKGGIQSDAQKFHEQKILRNNGIYLLANNKEICVKVINILLAQENNILNIVRQGLMEG